MRKTWTLLVALLAVTVGALVPAAGSGRAVNQMRTGYGITNAGSLVKFDAGNTSRARRVGTVTGLAAGEKVVGIDIRPVQGEIYGLTDRSNVYEINRNSARATLKSSLKAASGTPVALQGTTFGIDFNPTNDRLRVTSNAGQNLRIDVDTGMTAVDQTLAYGAGDRNSGGQPRVGAIAYSNNDNDSFLDPALLYPSGRRATGTKLYTIDSGQASLTLQDPPNNGTLSTVAKLRRRPKSAVGFDIFSPVNSEGNTVGNIGYASLSQGGRTRLYRISLRTGRATQVKGNGRLLRSVRDIAILP